MSPTTVSGRATGGKQDANRPLLAKPAGRTCSKPTERTERALIGASRRPDRCLEDKIKSAMKASEVHLQRTGRRLRITREIVANGEMYEEVDEDMEKRKARFKADPGAVAQLQDMNPDHADVHHQFAMTYPWAAALYTQPLLYCHSQPYLSQPPQVQLQFQIQNQYTGPMAAPSPVAQPPLEQFHLGNGLWGARGEPHSKHCLSLLERRQRTSRLPPGTVLKFGHQRPRRQSPIHAGPNYRVASPPASVFRPCPPVSSPPSTWSNGQPTPIPSPNTPFPTHSNSSYTTLGALGVYGHASPQRVSQDADHGFPSTPRTQHSDGGTLVHSNQELGAGLTSHGMLNHGDSYSTPNFGSMAFSPTGDFGASWNVGPLPGTPLGDKTGKFPEDNFWDPDAWEGID